jgi:polysaccharide deacetylase family protein (PEP-CTERM system associated)
MVNKPRRQPVTNDGSIRNAMTVDVEDYFHVSAFAARIRMEDWDVYESRVERNTQRILDLFDAAGTSSTFFVLGWVAERYPHLVKEIARRGHEVACHGYSHRLVYEQTPAVFRDETARSKAVLEDLVQAPVLGYRAASYSIIQRSIWALDILIEQGFAYDSSIFPVRHDRYGMPDAKREPHVWHTANSSSIVEFPLTTKVIMNYRLPISGGGYFRIFPYALTDWALSSINSHERRPFIFYLHPWEVDPGQPRIEAGWLSRFRHYHNLHRCEQRLQRLIGDYRFGTVSQVLKDLGLLSAAA